MKWYVIGAGISGIAAAKFLDAKGYKVEFLSTSAPKSSEFKNSNFNWTQQTEELPKDCCGLIVSPSVTADNPLRSAALARSIPVLTDLDLALDNYRGKIICVTGTNGKSSTVHMIEHILKQNYQAFAAGNIGVSPCDIIRLHDPEILILEVSSYQIELSKPIKANVSVWTTFSPDHLARHKTLENYFKIKSQLIYSTLETAVIGPNIPEIPNLPNHLKIQKPSLCGYFLDKPNQINAGLALAACKALVGINLHPKTVFEHYQSLEHRFERLPQPYSYVINDSKSTNLESTLTALDSMSEPCTLFLGGLDKFEDFSPLNQHPKIKSIILFGEAGPRIQSQLNISSKIFPTLKAALDTLTIKPPVLFSPGCASQDEFVNFEQRGKYFKERIFQSR